MKKLFIIFFLLAIVFPVTGCNNARCRARRKAWKHNIIEVRDTIDRHFFLYDEYDPHVN